MGEWKSLFAGYGDSHLQCPQSRIVRPGLCRIVITKATHWENNQFWQNIVTQYAVGLYL